MDSLLLEGGMRPALGRQGGKFYMYKKVINAFPADYEDTTYVEPFVGGGSIFFNKEPSKKEIINDFDTIMYDLYKIIKSNPKELMRRVNGEYTEKDFYDMKEMKPTSSIGKVAQYFLLKKLSYLGTGVIFDTTKKIKTIDKDFMPYHERLIHTTIRNEDYKKIINQYDSPNTFFYLDPPYENTAGTIDDYTDISFDEMKEILDGIKGRFLMSVNNSKRIRDLFRSYEITKVKTRYSLKKRFVTELLISNYKR